MTDRTGLARLNALPADEAAAAFRQCCGSSVWAARMTAARPFATVEALIEAAERIWWELREADWLEAFAAHPRIGARSGSAWSQQEQAGTSGASSATVAALADVNQRYEDRFGFIYIVCATGRTADEMRALAEARLSHHRDEELRNAAGEQRRITARRLEKLLAAS